MKRNRLCSLLLAVLMVLSLGTAAFASDEAEDTEAAILAWPSFRSGVFTASEKDSAARFVCYGEFDPAGDIVAFKGDTVSVALYDSETEGKLLTETEAVFDEAENGWVFSLPLPEENSVYWAGFEGGLRAPIYVVVSEAKTTQSLVNANIAEENEGAGSVAMSAYAPVGGLETSADGLYYDAYSGSVIVRPYIGTNSTLFSAGDFSDTENATDYERAAINWWLSSGFTNGGDSYGVFGYDREAFYTFELTLFVYRYFGVYDNAYGKPMEGFSIGSEPYFVSIMNTDGTGIIDDIEAVEPKTSIDCSAALSRQDILATLYNAMKSGYAKLSPAGEIAAAGLPAADTPAAKAEAMAALLGLDAGNLSEKVGKVAAVEIFYELAKGNYITSLTYPDEDYARATSLDVEGTENLANGNDKTTAYDVNLYINEDAELSGKDAVIDIEGNYNALVVAEGARVRLDDPYLSTTTSNSDYGFGGGAVLMVRDKGSVASLYGRDGSINVNVNTSSSAGGLMPLCDGTIYSRNLHIYSPGTHTSNLTYNGVLWYDQGTVLGDGRIFSTDYWGGYLMFNECVSFKGEGSGGSVLDETSIVYYKNSYIHGSSTSEINGCGTVYYENCIADFDAFYEFHNNTSYWTDTGSLYAVNSVLNFGESFYWDAKAAKSVVTLADSRVTLSEDSEYAVAVGYTKGGKDFMTSEEMEPGAEAVSYIVKSLEGDAAEQVNGYSVLRLYGDSAISGGACKLYIGERYTLAIETDAAFDAADGKTEFILDRSEFGNSGSLYVNGELLADAGVYDFGALVITVTEGGGEVTWQDFQDWLLEILPDVCPFPDQVGPIIEEAQSWDDIDIEGNGPWGKIFGEEYFNASSFDEFVAAGGVGTYNAEYIDLPAEDAPASGEAS